MKSLGSACTLALLAAALSLPGSAQAQCGGFTDVFETDFYCDNVEWLKNREITLGCSPTEYCPDVKVNRGQMAAFMNRLGKALTPEFIVVADAGAIDLSAGDDFMCLTTEDYTPTHPQRAYATAHSTVRAPASGAMDWASLVIYSTDGGVTWLDFPNVQVLGPTSAPQEYATDSSQGTLDMDPGTNYRFGVAYTAFFGTGAQTDESLCSLFVQVLNRNPDSSPFFRFSGGEAAQEAAPGTRMAEYLERNQR
jgi:hypothetical protein